MKQKVFIPIGLLLIVMGMLAFQGCKKTADEFNPFNPENNLTEDNTKNNDLQFARIAPLLENFSEPGDTMTFALDLFGPKPLYAHAFLSSLLVATAAFKPLVYYHEIPGTGTRVFDVSVQGFCGTINYGYFTSSISHSGHINYTATEIVNYTATGSYYVPIIGNFSWNIPGDSTWIYSIP